MANYNLVCTYSLLVGHMVLLLVVLAVGRVNKCEPTAITLLAARLGLVLQQVTIVSLGLAPPLGHELDHKHLETVQAQDVLGAVMFLKSEIFLTF